jgi:mono/diheme cytochrome c family protein
MPYPYYGKMDREDIFDIIAYIRSIPPIESNIPDSEADFPVNLILRTMPQNAELVKKPDPSDQVAYGKYLVNASACIECHTQLTPQGVINPELAFSGGRSFPFPDGSVVTSSNITPDKKTGIGNWTEEMFVQRFKQYTDSAYINPKIAPGEFNSLMPWIMYSGMKESDLKAIYAYLMSLPAKQNEVVKFTASK